VPQCREPQNIPCVAGHRGEPRRFPRSRKCTEVKWAERSLQPGLARTSANDDRIQLEASPRNPGVRSHRSMSSAPPPRRPIRQGDLIDEGVAAGQLSYTPPTGASLRPGANHRIGRAGARAKERAPFSLATTSRSLQPRSVLKIAGSEGRRRNSLAITNKGPSLSESSNRLCHSIAIDAFRSAACCWLRREGLVSTSVAWAWVRNSGTRGAHARRHTLAFRGRAPAQQGAVSARLP